MSQNFSLFYLCFLFALLCASCRPRVESQLSLRPGLDKLLVFDQKEALDICSRDILIFYVGNAQGLGPVHYLPKLKDAFGQDHIERFEKDEAVDESGYFYEVDKQGRLLQNAIAGKGKSRTGIDICEKLKLKKYGRVVSVIITDGPNKYVVEDQNGNVEVHERAADSEVRIKEFKVLNGKWQEIKHEDWPISLSGLPVKALPAGKATELFLPEDLSAIQDWLMDFLKDYGYESGFDQTLFFLKSHGAQRTYTQDRLGTSLSEMIIPQGTAAFSVFMFDQDMRHGKRGEESLYFYPLWSPRTICEFAAQGNKEVIVSCLKRLSAQRQVERQVQSTQAKRDPLVGFTLGPGPWSGVTQGFFGANVIFGGGGHNTKPRRTFHLPYVQAGSRPDGYQISQPLHLSELAKIKLSREQLKGYPEAYRFLGDGIALIKENDEQVELRLTPGSKNASLVILDTCSANLIPFVKIKGIPWMPNSKVPMAVLSNPMPLFAKALNYGSLDPFQLAYLASLFAQSDEKNLNAKTRNKINKILEIFQSDPKLAEDDKTPFQRLRLTLFKCPNDDRDCLAYRPLNTLFAVEQAYLALREVQQSLSEAARGKTNIDYGTFHSLATAFNDGLIRILDGRYFWHAEYMYSYYKKQQDRRMTITPVILAMNQNFLLRHGAKHLVAEPKTMMRMIKLWSYYAEDVIYAMKRTDFKDRWNKIFENRALEELIIADLVLARQIILEALDHKRKHGELPTKEKHLINRTVPELIDSYWFVTRSFRPALPDLLKLREESDIFAKKNLELFIRTLDID